MADHLCVTIYRIVVVVVVAFLLFYFHEVDQPEVDPAAVAMKDGDDNTHKRMRNKKKIAFLLGTPHDRSPTHCHSTISDALPQLLDSTFGFCYEAVAILQEKQKTKKEPGRFVGISGDIFLCFFPFHVVW